MSFFAIGSSWENTSAATHVENLVVGRLVPQWVQLIGAAGCQIERWFPKLRKRIEHLPTRPTRLDRSVLTLYLRMALMEGSAVPY